LFLRETRETRVVSIALGWMDLERRPSDSFEPESKKILFGNHPGYKHDTNLNFDL
jgi:hypothetical protein